MVNYKKTKKKISVIVQARMGSAARLPRKVLLEMAGKSMLWHIINRLRLSKQVNEIILAIPDTKENDVLESFAQDYNLKYFRGSEEDVLSRYYKTAKKFKCEVIVRVTADNPLIDPEIMDVIIEKHLSSKADYTSNNLKKTFPLGLDIEIFNFRTLDMAYRKSKENHQREHVTPYIYEHPEMFKLHNVEAEGKLKRPEFRLTVDTKEDLELVRAIYKHLYKGKRIFYTEEIIDLLNRYPELIEINVKVQQKILG